MLIWFMKDNSIMLSWSTKKGEFISKNFKDVVTASEFWLNYFDRNSKNERRKSVDQVQFLMGDNVDIALEINDVLDELYTGETCFTQKNVTLFLCFIRRSALMCKFFSYTGMRHSSLAEIDLYPYDEQLIKSITDVFNRTTDEETKRTIQCFIKELMSDFCQLAR